VSSDGFTVDLDALGAARDRVGRLAADLTEPPPAVPGVEVFGHGRLTEAAEEFAAREKHGRERLAGEAESIRRGLAETIETYRQADEDGAGRFGRIAR